MDKRGCKRGCTPTLPRELPLPGPTSELQSGASAERSRITLSLYNSLSGFSSTHFRPNRTEALAVHPRVPVCLISRKGIRYPDNSSGIIPYTALILYQRLSTSFPPLSKKVCHCCPKALPRSSALKAFHVRLHVVEYQPYQTARQNIRTASWVETTLRPTLNAYARHKHRNVNPSVSPQLARLRGARHTGEHTSAPHSASALAAAAWNRLRGLRVFL